MEKSSFAEMIKFTVESESEEGLINPHAIVITENKEFIYIALDEFFKRENVNGKDMASFYLKEIVKTKKATDIAFISEAYMRSYKDEKNYVPGNLEFDEKAIEIVMASLESKKENGEIEKSFLTWNVQKKVGGDGKMERTLVFQEEKEVPEQTGRFASFF